MYMVCLVYFGGAWWEFLDSGIGIEVIGGGDVEGSYESGWIAWVEHMSAWGWSWKRMLLDLEVSDDNSNRKF